MAMTVAAAVVERDGKIMICQRRPDAHNGLKWEFPGGKLEDGEAPEEALKRELREELQIEADVGRILDAVFYRYPERDVLLLFYRCAIAKGEPCPVDCNAVQWVEPSKLLDYDFAGADRKFLERNPRD